LGMRSTFFGDDNTRIIRNRAFSYVMEDGKYKNQIMRYDLVGSGGVYSNIRDLYLWDQNFYHNKLGKGSQALIDTMHVEGMLSNGKSSGYAFALQNGTYRGLRTVTHGGALAGYRSYLLRFPQQKVSVIILGNLIPIPINTLPYSIADVVLEKQLAPVVADSTSNKANNVKEELKDFPVENASDYAGAFYSEELDVIYEVTEKNNQLYCSIKGKRPIALIHQSQDFFITEDDVELKFERGSKNQITGFSINAGRVTDLKFKRK